MSYRLPPQGFPISYGAADFIIFTSGSTVYAYNTATRAIISSGTDAGAVINAAIAAFGATGGRIFIKSGNYTCTTSIAFTSAGQVIEGEGNSTLLLFNGSTLTPLFKMADTTSRAYLGIRNLRIQSSSSGTGLAINADYFQVTKISNVIIEQVNQGIDISNGSAFYNIIDNVRVGASGTGGFGIRLARNENTVLRSRILANDSNNVTGIIVNAKGNSLISCDVEGGASVVQIGIDVQSGGDDCMIQDCWLEGNNTNLQLASGIKGFVLTGGAIIDAKTSLTTNITDNGAVRPLIRCRLGSTASPSSGVGYEDYSSISLKPSTPWNTTKFVGSHGKLFGAYYGLSTTCIGLPTATATGTAVAGSDATEGRYSEYQSTATATTPAGHRGGAISERRQNVRFKCRFRLTVAALTDYRVFMGLTSDTAAFATGNDPVSTTRNAVIICKRATDTNWFIGHNDGAGAAVYDDTTIAVPAINTWVTVEVRADATNNRFQISIDNSAYQNVTADIPSAATLLGYWAHIESVNATDVRINLPYYEAEADR